MSDAAAAKLMYFDLLCKCCLANECRHTAAVLFGTVVIITRRTTTTTTDAEEMCTMFVPNKKYMLSLLMMGCLLLALMMMFNGGGQLKYSSDVSSFAIPKKSVLLKKNWNWNWDCVVCAIQCLIFFLLSVFGIHFFVFTLLFRRVEKIKRIKLFS